MLSQGCCSVTLSPALPTPGCALQHFRTIFPQTPLIPVPLLPTVLSQSTSPSLQENKRESRRRIKIFIWSQRPVESGRPPRGREGSAAGAAARLPGSARGSPALTMPQIAVKAFIAQSSSPYRSTLWLKERHPFKASLQQSLYFYFKSIWKLKIPFGTRPLWRESQACRLAKL